VVGRSRTAVAISSLPLAILLQVMTDIAGMVLVCNPSVTRCPCIVLVRSHGRSVVRCEGARAGPAYQAAHWAKRPGLSGHVSIYSPQPGHSCGSAIFKFTHRIQTFPRHLQSFVDNRLRDSQAWSAGAGGAIVGRCAVGTFCLLAIDSSSSSSSSVVGRTGTVYGPGGVWRQRCVLPYIFDDAAKEGRESGYVAGAEQRKRVGLDYCGPVGRVRVEGMEEVVLNSVQARVKCQLGFLPCFCSG
jgi:hypothetical protein